jgi:large subunit ribosomal protein L33
MVSASPHPHANGVFVIVCYFFFCSLNFTTPCFFVPIHVLDKPPKKATVLIQLLSTAGTGFFYTARKNPRTVQRKLAFRKYDPIVRRHVLFEEKKLPSGKKR